MSTYQSAPRPEQAPTLAPAKGRRWPWIVGIITALVIGYAAGAASPDPSPGGTASATNDSTDSAKTANQEKEPVEEPPAEAEPAEPTYPDPKPGDFTLEVKILDKQCFGSAGCNVTYRIDVAYDGPALNPDVTYELIYEVTGGDDGAMINTIEVTGDDATVDSEEFASIASSDAVLKATVTEIL